jgi:hypothetical protein
LSACRETTLIVVDWFRIIVSEFGDHGQIQLLEGTRERYGAPLIGKLG